jgi:hypothetical protein
LELPTIATAGQDAAISRPQGSGWKLHGVSARLLLAASEQDDASAGAAALGSRVMYQRAFSAAAPGSGGRLRRWLRPGAIVRVTHQCQAPSGRSPRVTTGDAEQAATGSSSGAEQRTYLVQALYRDQLYGVKSGGEAMVQVGNGAGWTG